ncbi:Transposon Tn10 TetD protein [Posidoniimonas polymericola]|uniref:Transposon Tn10 TetD protein n=1 Tax=Posidoniimonas polymericola TaxID=2528002 RepID=A0A5C5YFM2_9BACT|nr:AraC family transcriptional regulator [Posidoniimonas polymericola]TWT74526.1 Transposon Tn10 TetD protein [Posidoniimonas polymericola]
MKPAFEKLISPEGCSIRCSQGLAVKKSENRWHYHPEIELTLIERGTGTRLVGDHVESYGVGDMVLLGSNLPHHWAVVEPRKQDYTIHRAMVVQFSPSLFSEAFVAVPEMQPVGELLDRAKRGIRITGKARRNVARMMTEMRDQTASDRFISLLRCLFYVASIEETTLLASESYSPVWRTKAESRLNDILTYIHVNLADPDLTQNELADLAGMTPSAFSRFFRKATQRTVISYINEKRISLACRMLLERERSVLDISLEVGYDTVSYFNRRFRQVKGMTPREFRERFRGHAAWESLA